MNVAASRSVVAGPPSAAEPPSSAVAPPKASAEDAALGRACVEFESVLVRQLLSTMKTGAEGNAYGGMITDALAGAGALVGSARELARYAQCATDRIEHPLQAFSPRAFSLVGDPRLRSHHREYAQALHAALAAAQVGIAMSTGTDVAMETAGITLMRGDPRLVADAFDVSRRTVAKIRQGLFWAFAYNVLGIPLAAFGLLNPVVAGAAMAMSSVSVVSNSLLLKRWRLQGQRRP